MKRKEKNSILLIMGILVLALTSLLYVFGEAEKTDTVPYEFPITIYDEEWTEFATKQEKLDVCQIPQEKLKNMTTDALLETVLNYPLINSFDAFNSIEDACRVFLNEFNGFRELLERPDVSESLIKKYAEVQVVMEDELELVSLEKFFLPATLEYLFACDEIQNGKYYGEHAEKVFELVSEKTEAREKAGIYSATSEIYMVYTLERSEIDLLSAGDMWIPTLIKTPNGTWIPLAYIRSPEYTDAEIKEINEYWDKAYPGATRVGNASVKYNCHSYAWYQRSIANSYWIGGGPADTYVKDGSYYKHSDSNASAGMIYYYNNGEHSGVSIGNKTINGREVPYVRSKWGKAGLYVHAYNDCPYTKSYTLYVRKKDTYK